MEAEETELEMVRRHVREGEEHLAHQWALITRLRASHLPPDEAEALLDTFRELQRQHEAHLARIEDEEAKRALAAPATDLIKDDLMINDPEVAQDRTEIHRIMRHLDGFARRLGLDEVATLQIVEKVTADMPMRSVEERLVESRTWMIEASA